jgi:hypothetical protein
MPRRANIVRRLSIHSAPTRRRLIGAFLILAVQAGALIGLAFFQPRLSKRAAPARAGL